MSQTHTQRLREEQKRRREAREARERAEAVETAAVDRPEGVQSEPESPAAPLPALPDPVQNARRPQPFTSDLLPSTEAVDASGAMSAEERDELDRCERAFANADQAQWMRGLALHAVRDRKLYRDGGRTWADYCEEIGLSESDANRMIQEYPLARSIAQIWVTPKMVPASHVRALLPLVQQFDLEQTAQGYVKLRLWAQENGQRVTASHLTAMIERSAIERSASDSPLPVAEFAARVRELESGVPAQGGPPASEAAAPKASGSSTTRHPNLGGAPGGNSPGSPVHPDLGDQATDVRTNEHDVVDAEIVDDETAQAVSQALAELSHGIADKLSGASPETLKGIAAAAGTIITAAQDALSGR